MTQIHPSRRLAYSLLSATLISFTAGAQQTSAPTSTNPLDEIIVRATMIERDLAHTPAAVSIIDQDTIQLARQQLALDESLGSVPGLFMQNRFNFAQDLRVSIRGFGARAQFGIRGIKVLVDGIPETLPDGQGSVDSIDLGATSQIEVIRGPSSSLYGNASGGVISVISESGSEEPFAEMRLAGGSDDFQKVQLKAGGRGERLDYLISLSDTDYEGWRQQSHAENKQLTGRFGLDLGKDRELLTVVNFTDQPISDDAGGLTAAQVAANPRAAFPANVTFDAGESLDQTRVGFVYSMPLGEHHSITARNYYAWRDFGNLLPTLVNGIVDLDREFMGGGFSYSYDGIFLDRPNRLVAGTDFDDQDDERRRYNNNNGVQGTLGFDQNEHVTSAGVFLQNELSVTQRLQLTMGVRFDEVEFEVTDRYFADGFNDSGSKKFDDTSPMVGVVLDLGEETNLYATYSTAFETPTTTEFNKPDGTGGFNLLLEPQTATNLEVGLRGTLSDRSRYEVALFTIDVEDELIPFEVVPGRNAFENAGESKRDGLEFSFIFNPTDRLSGTVSYTYSDFKFTNFGTFSGNVIPGTAENVVFGELAYTHPGGWFIAGETIYVDEQFGDNANTTVIDGYTVAGMRFGYDLDLGEFQLSPFLGVNNLFDEEYTANVRLNPFQSRYYEPAPGRNGYAGVTLAYHFR